MKTMKENSSSYLTALLTALYNCQDEELALGFEIIVFDWGVYTFF